MGTAQYKFLILLGKESQDDLNYELVNIAIVHADAMANSLLNFALNKYM